MATLTPKQLKFARHLFEGKTQSEAYKLSYDAQDMTDASVAAEAKKLAANPAIVDKVEEMKRDAEFVAELNVAWVLKQYMRLATADPNELVETMRINCRYCHGAGHAYQWRDAMEWATAVAQVMAYNAALENNRNKDKPPPKEIPSADGGYGFQGLREPHPQCPHCDGVGSEYTHIHASRKAKSPLYAGVKQTKDGVQILMRSQDNALDWLAKYVGIDKKEIALTGPGGGPLKSISALTSDPAEASKMYAALISADKPNAPSV